MTLEFLDCCADLLFEHIEDRASACCVVCRKVMQCGRPYQRKVQHAGGEEAKGG